MIHPHTELQFISEEIGYGVVATKHIPKGTITWVQDKLDREFSPEQVKDLAPALQNILDIYTFRNSKGNHVLCWDHGRFVNHSFKSNCLSTAYDFEIAIRDIEPGEQLTDDYGYLNISEPFRGYDEGTKRKIVYPDDLKKYHKIWDKALQQAFPLLNTVEQPLLPILSENTKSKVDKVLLGEEKMASILSLYYAD